MKEKCPCLSCLCLKKQKPGAFPYRQWDPFQGHMAVFNPFKQEILLATTEETVFFHELSHAAYERVVEKLKPGQL